ncbi:putative transposase [Streptococcus pneumoniae GA19077]|nr:putative transposase [Streptococcus pneumoniae GA19077]
MFQCPSFVLVIVIVLKRRTSFITPVLERFNQLLFRMNSGFATPKLYDLIEKQGNTTS